MLRIGRNPFVIGGFLCVAALLASAASAREARCRSNSGVTGRCYWIREFALSADSLFIVDRDDNGRWVIIRNARIHRSDWPVDDAVPHNLDLFYNKAADVAGLGGATVRGDFEVCPIPKQGLADTAYACIQTATHLKRVSRDWMSPAQKRRHDRAVAAARKDRARAVAAEKKQDAEDAALEMERKLGIIPP